LEDRRRTLALDMRHAIMSIQYGHTKLREFTNKLVVAKRLLVSLRMANFLHYRWIEEKIEGIQQELPAINNRIASQAEITAKRMAAETKNFIDYTLWKPTQFPFVEGITNRITEMGIYYKQNVDQALELLRGTLKDVRRQLDGLEYYKGQFTSFYEHNQLSVGELPVCALPEIKVTGSDFLKNDKALGTLFLTNKRLLFIAETGRVRKKMETVFDFPLIYLKSIEEDGRLRKRLVLNLKQGDVKISCTDQTKKVLPDYVEIARTFDKYIQTDMQRVRKIEQQDVNTSEVRLKIEGMVYSLLSTNTRSQYVDDEMLRRPTPGPRTPDWDRSRPRPSPFGEYYRKPETFREELDRTIGRYDQGRPSYPNSPKMHALQRDAASIENAIRDTVHMLRSGQLMAEDFIRRYKDLMRDSFHNKREMDQVARSSRDSPW
jgi:ribosomal protein S17E